MRFQATDFNPRSPYGERPCFMVLFSQRAGFQSTLPLRGATHTSHHPCWDAKFQSTLPLRGATGGKMGLTPPHRNFNPRSPYGERPDDPADSDAPRKISIHAPLTGSDPNTIRERATEGNFNPRSPYGERPAGGGRRPASLDFNPRSPYGERP